jgi:hypothetical protein
MEERRKEAAQLVEAGADETEGDQEEEGTEGTEESVYY